MPSRRPLSHRSRPTSSAPDARVLSGATPHIEFEGFYVRDTDGDPRVARVAARELENGRGSPWQVAGRSSQRRGARGDSSATSPLPGVVVEWVAPRGSRLERPSPADAWALSRELAAAAKRGITAPAAKRGITFEPLFGIHGATVRAEHAHVPAVRSRAKGGSSDCGSTKGALPCAADDPAWSLARIGAPAAWALPGGVSAFGAGIRIGHPDTGYQLHPEIWPDDPAQRRVRPDLGYDFLDEDPDPLDPLVGDAPGHGTATASVIMSDSAISGPRFVTGVAPRAELVPLRVSWSVIHFSFARVTRAIRHAVDVGAHVVSMSLGGPFPSGALEDAVDFAIARDVVVLAAAGNVWPWVVYPARYEPVLAVAASNCLDRPWKSSASGGAVDVTAPGESVWRAETHTKGGRLVTCVGPSSGTSYAVATTAGACALWLAYHGREELQRLHGVGNVAAAFRRELVTFGVRTPVGWDTDEFGAGILDVHALLAGGRPGPHAKLARSKRAAAKPRLPQDRVERVLETFAPAERARVEGFLERRLGRGKARAGALSRLGDELVFQMATNPEARARALGKPVRTRATRGKGAGGPTAASPELAQLLRS